MLGIIAVTIPKDKEKDVGSFLYNGKRYGGQEDYRTHCYGVGERRVCEMMFTCEADE